MEMEFHLCTLELLPGGLSASSGWETLQSYLPVFSWDEGGGTALPQYQDFSPSSESVPLSGSPPLSLSSENEICLLHLNYSIP